MFLLMKELKIIIRSQTWIDLLFIILRDYLIFLIKNILFNIAYVLFAFAKIKYVFK